MTLRIATWNINSVRLRLPQLATWMAECNPDIVALQETKVQDHLFPAEAITALGYPHLVYRGEKSYNGVAILSKLPLHRPCHHLFGGRDDTRHISASLENGMELHNFYVPAGGDEPDPAINPKFAHKLEFLRDMRRYFCDHLSPTKQVIMGDFNIAPYEHDVWSHKQLLKVVSHTPIEVEHLLELYKSAPWVDVLRHLTPMDQKLYSWWSYRNREWKRDNRGRRLDHIWMTSDLLPYLENAGIMPHMRDIVSPSDHVPVWMDIAYS